MREEQSEGEELAARLCEGDPAAVRALYERYGSALLRFALAMTDCRASAEDVVHDTFVELMRHPSRFDMTRGPLIAYLYGIARHRVARLARSARGTPAAQVESDSPSNESPPDATDGDDSLEERVSHSQRLAQLRAAMTDLPLAHREVIALCDLEELPYTTVALILDCPVGTVRSRLHRARALLAMRLRALDDPHLPAPAQEQATPGSQSCTAMPFDCRRTCP